MMQQRIASLFLFLVVANYTKTDAVVPLYQGPNVIPPTSTAEIAAMALRAKGSNGSCAAYIKGVADHLRELGIYDPAVVDLCSALGKITRPPPASDGGRTAPK
jgi:cation transport regulator ChaC